MLSHLVSSTVSYNTGPSSNPPGEDKTNQDRVLNNETLLEDVDYEPYYDLLLYDNVALNAFLVIFVTMGSVIISSIGLCTNTINIIIFYRQGLLSDSSTASLFCLTISDLFICALKLISSILYLPYEMASFVTMTPVKQAMINAFDLGVLFSRQIFTFMATTTWITTFISLERMISVTFPFHVKRIFTPQSTYLIMGLFFIASFIIFIPNLLYNKLVFADTSNESLPLSTDNLQPSGLIPLSLSFLQQTVTDLYMWPACTVGIVVMNVIIVVKVNSAKKFRSSTATLSTNVSKSTKNDNIQDSNDLEGSKKDESISSSKKAVDKEAVLTRMMIIMCLMFILCYTPQIVYIVCWQFGSFHDDFLSLLDLILVFTETINSSFNIFIYYSMSSRYKTQFDRLCHRCASS